MQEKSNIQDKPNLPKRLFWEFKYDDIDWRDAYQEVMIRVFEWGSPEEWEEMIRFYGKEKVIKILKTEIKFLADYAIEKVCNYFSLHKEELLCYISKQSKVGHWI